MKYLMVAMSFSILFYACEETSSTASSAASDTTTLKVQTSQPEVLTPKAGFSSVAPDAKELEKVAQIIAFSSFNNTIKTASTSGDEWTTSPLLVALRFAGAQMDSRIKSIRAESLSGGESFDKVLVTIEEDGLMDDSVRGHMSILRMEFTNGKWQISKASRVWKCWKGRGHEGYGGEPCH